MNATVQQVSLPPVESPELEFAEDVINLTSSVHTKSVQILAVC